MYIGVLVSLVARIAADKIMFNDLNIIGMEIQKKYLVAAGATSADAPIHPATNGQTAKHIIIESSYRNALWHTDSTICKS